MTVAQKQGSRLSRKRGTKKRDERSKSILERERMQAGDKNESVIVAKREGGIK